MRLKSHNNSNPEVQAYEGLTRCQLSYHAAEFARGYNSLVHLREFCRQLAAMFDMQSASQISGLAAARPNAAQPDQMTRKGCSESK